MSTEDHEGCWECDGSGDCPKCEGDGATDDGYCPECDGGGDCPVCEGSGSFHA